MVSDFFPVARHHVALDLGCGAGNNARVVARMCHKVVAIDASEAQLAIARENTPEENITFVRQDATQYLESAESQSFDRVFAVFSLEYVADLGPVFRGVHRALRSGGRFLYCDLHPFAGGADLVGVTADSFMGSLSYRKEGPRHFTWELAGTSVRLVRYHRTLATLLGVAHDAGLSLLALSEPQVHPMPNFVAYRDSSISAQDEVWSRVPYSLVLVFGVDDV